MKDPEKISDVVDEKNFGLEEASEQRVSETLFVVLEYIIPADISGRETSSSTVTAEID